MKNKIYFTHKHESYYLKRIANTVKYEVYKEVPFGCQDDVKVCEISTDSATSEECRLEGNYCFGINEHIMDIALAAIKTYKTIRYMERHNE